jgi:hypothetical protein
MTSDDIAKLVDEECAVATFIPLAKALAPFRVTPFVRTLRWPYSKDEPEFPCWIFADLEKKKTGLTLAYSEFGHGERGDHWGVVSAEEKFFGRDDSWFLRLEDAFIAAGVWSERLPESYEAR